MMQQSSERTWQEHLRAKGHRITPQRKLILAAVAQLPHPTPESILQHLRQTEPTLNLSTVYRNLTVLQESGLITHAHIGTGSAVYHLADEHAHLHLNCLNCGRLVSAAASIAADFAREVSAQTGFLIDPTHAAVYGTCADCARELTTPAAR